MYSSWSVRQADQASVLFKFLFMFSKPLCLLPGQDPPGGTRDLSSNRHSCGDSGRGCLNHPSRFFRTSFQKGCTLGHSHRGWRNMPASLLHFQHFLSWVKPIFNGFSGFIMDKLTPPIPCNPANICNHILPSPFSPPTRQISEFCHGPLRLIQ